jgi:hypothetical protein
MDDDVHKGLALRRDDPVTFRASYRIAVEKTIPDDMLSWEKPVFSVEFVIERTVTEVVVEVGSVPVLPGANNH